MKAPIKSWKTNAAGLGMILTALGAICTGISKDEYDVVLAAIPAILGGIGLLNARDNDKTSEEVGAQQKAVARAYEGTGEEK